MSHSVPVHPSCHSKKCVGGGCCAGWSNALVMPPKKATVLVQLLSTAGTGFFYTARRNTRARKLAFRKYDPIVRQHVLFCEHAFFF